MLKALIKKQLMEVNTWLLQDKKKGTQRSKGGILGYVILYMFLFGVLGMLFFGMGIGLGEPMHNMGLDWLYFSMMGMMALLLGLFGSVFNTSATLYQAKDNGLLLSMPIPPRYILMVRLFGVWMWSFIYVALAFLPALLAYWMFCAVSPAAVICGLLVMVLLSFLILALACALGWVVAKISARTRHKSIITMILSLLFFVAYYYVYFRINTILQAIIANAQTAGRVISKILPIYWMGKASAGDFLNLLLFALVVCACLGVAVIVMSRTFLTMATASENTGKKEYRKTGMKSSGVNGALLKRELRHFTSSAIYMMNCGLGCVIFPVLGILALVKADMLRNLANMMEMGDLLLPIACGVLCMCASMDAISAPSVSLEGKNLWLAQSLPVEPWQVLKAKLGLHLMIGEPPVMFCALCVGLALKLTVAECVLLVVLPALFVLLSGVFGLAVNLKCPNLTWTAEAVPVKQSLSVTLTLFGGWVFVIALGGAYYLLRNVLNPVEYVIACAVVVLLLCRILLRWLQTKGSAIFARL